MGFALLCSPNRRDTDLGHMLRLRRWRRCVTTVWPAACLFDNYGFPHWLLSTRYLWCADFGFKYSGIPVSLLSIAAPCEKIYHRCLFFISRYDWTLPHSLCFGRSWPTDWFLFTRVIQSSSWCFASLTSVCFNCPRFVWKDIHARSVCQTKVFQRAVTYP